LRHLLIFNELKAFWQSSTYWYRSSNW